MKLDVYLNYDGKCEQAFRFYEQHLGGKITAMRTHDQQPNQANVPADWKKAILHARIELGGMVLMGADIPGAEPMRSAYLTFTADSDEEAERVYALLSDGGQVFMQMEETFFASRFAMLRDRFGTSWMILHERQEDVAVQVKRPGQVMREAHILAHRSSSGHREQVLASEVCGCFYCLETFPPDEIEEWVDEAPNTSVGTTALCPRCGIDSVIGSASGFPIVPEFLRRMKSHWF